jgi:uncharacterized protein YjbI with pentapeptide repeats
MLLWEEARPMANPEHLAKLREGVKKWNRWRKANPDVRPELAEADFREANLRGMNAIGADLTKADLRLAKLVNANLSGADLAGANIRYATLDFADLQGAKLVDAILGHSYLRSANLRSADLRGADLAGADLVGANLNGAILKASKFERARLSSTAFGACDLSEVRGLDLARHEGPSIIGIDTIYFSKGKIPEAFLRGAGVPENLITYIPSLVGPTLEFYSCFISYSTKDQKFAERLYADLQAKGVRCWFAPHDMEAGKKVHEQIDQAIRLHERLLLLLSPYSIHSEWVKTEIKKARKREIAEKRRVLFPIGLTSFERLKKWEYLDPDTGEDIALKIREYYIPDFTGWEKDHDLYQKEFDMLLKSLQSEGEAASPAVG